MLRGLEAYVIAMNDQASDKTKATAVTLMPVEANLPAVPALLRISVARKTVARENWKNRHFKDFNALNTEFRNCDFRYSIFERAYFRKAKFVECNFEGAQFFDCNLKSSNFYNCDLKYTRFQKTLLELNDVIASLPAEPNIRQESLQNLRANMIEVGDYASQSRLILQEVEAAKRHYKYALVGFDSYYRKKYLGYLPKFRALVRLSLLHLSGLIWGHGEKPGRLLISSAAILIFLAGLNFWSVLQNVGWPETRGGGKILEYVVQLFLDMSPNPRFRGFEFVDYAVVIMRYIYIGLFISVLYKSISHR